MHTLHLPVFSVLLVGLRLYMYGVWGAMIFDRSRQSWAHLAFGSRFTLSWIERDPFGYQKSLIYLYPYTVYAVSIFRPIRDLE